MQTFGFLLILAIWILVVIGAFSISPILGVIIILATTLLAIWMFGGFEEDPYKGAINNNENDEYEKYE